MSRNKNRQNTAAKEPVYNFPVVKIDGRYEALLPREIIAPAATPSQITDEDARQTSNRWVEWGKNDDYPTRVRKLIQKVSIAGTTIRKLTAKMVGNGIAYYKNEDIADGKVSRASIPDVDAWLRDNRINTKWLPGQAAAYCYHMNPFGSFILSKDRKKIARIIHRDSEHCRVKLNDKLTKVQSMVYSPLFTTGYPALDAQMSVMPMMVLDTFDSTNIVNSNTRTSEFGYHTYFETPGSFYYGVPFWEALFADDGWMHVSANVPGMITAMHRNQVSLKYMLNIPENYFLTRYTDWRTMLDSQKITAINELVNTLNERLTGTANVAKTIHQVFKEDPVTHAAFGKIEIVAVDDKFKRDAWIPDSNISDAQIVQGFGEHPSQVGLAPAGGKMGAGSGSDQRESYNTSIALNTIDQTIILEPLNFISQYNQWGVTFFIDNQLHTTTNNEESGVVDGKGSLTVEDKKPVTE